MTFPLLVVATTNVGKLREFRHLFEGLPVHLVTYQEATGHSPPEVEEDGLTFAENAFKKAHTLAYACKHLTLADDSGLEVDALQGRPGIRSARFAHPHATDAENLEALTRALKTLPHPTPNTTGNLFSARFRCSLALVNPHTASTDRVDGVCEGFVRDTPSGHGGFGYDPLFVVAGSTRTLAEYSPEEKHRVSHRANAARSLRPLLLERLNTQSYV